MSAPHRLHDLADVLDLIRSAKLPADLGAEPGTQQPERTVP
jgi:hypothetical protein